MTQLDLQQKLEQAEAETRFIGGALAICQKDLSECREVMSALIEERDALQQQVNALAAEPVAAPEGWRLVPVEPTDEMLHASYREASVYSPSAYRAMIAAAPKP